LKSRYLDDSGINKLEKGKLFMALQIASTIKKANTRSFSRAVAEIMNEPDLDDVQVRTRAYCLALHMYYLAMKKNDIRAARFLIERFEGATPQRVDINLEASVKQVSLHMQVGEASEAYQDLLKNFGETGTIDLAPEEYTAAWPQIESKPARVKRVLRKAAK
jgi:ADP-dependent phosphofructokinase/glucokinase